MNLNPDKKFYKISEVAKMFDVNASLLRYWETQFESLQPLKTKSGSRLYDLKSIEVVKQIYSLTKEQGFTLPGAKEIIDKLPQKEPSLADIREKLFKIRGFLQELRNNLEP
jgi:DNA-binding transcriptional MerR regulator